MDVSIDELQQMADRAGLGMSPQEVAELKPIYDLLRRLCRAVARHRLRRGGTSGDVSSRLAGGVAGDGVSGFRGYRRSQDGVNGNG